jgi:hypothetical protein
MGADAAVQILIGVVLLFLGRKLFWVFVGAAGFITGLNVAETLLAGGQSWTRLAVGLIAAIIGAVLAIFLQKVMVAVAGFLIGGYLILELLQAANVILPPIWVLAAYIVGGIIGAILVIGLFDWALIILSSIAGAVMITHGLHLTGSSAGILALALIILGVAVQASLMRRRRSTT